MRTLLFAVISVPVLAVGCVSVAPIASQPATGAPAVSLPPIATPVPQTAAPTAVVASPVATATAAAPATPVAEPSPTGAPTLEPTTEPSVGPTESPIETPAADVNDLLFHDTMDDPASGWDTVSGDRAEIAFDVGALEFAINMENSFAYSARDLEDDFGVVLVAGEFISEGDGAAGLLCIGQNDAGGNVAYGAVFTAGGAVNFVSIDSGVQEILEENPEVGTELPVGTSTVFGLACGATSTGALRLTAFGDDTGPLATFQTNEGTASFNGVAAYAESATAGFVLDVSTVATYGIPGSTTGMTPEGEELLTHVPPDWQSQCIESPASEGELAIVVCFLQQDGAGPELATYELHSSSESMATAYQDRIDTFGVESEGTCEEGPNETTWSIDEVQFGRVQCAPQQVGIRFDWTDDRLNVLSTLVDFEGRYGNTFDAWIEAGPLE